MNAKLNEQTIDERCAMLAGEAEFHACAVAERDAVYGGELGKIRIIQLATRIIALREQQAQGVQS